jgi:hypothetical protein
LERFPDVVRYWLIASSISIYIFLRTPFCF